MTLNAFTTLSHNGRQRWRSRGAASDASRQDRENRVTVESSGGGQPSSRCAADDDSGAWERDCVLQARQGDPAAFGRLVNHYAPRIYAHLYRLVGNREEAEDLAQESFLRAFRALDRFDAARPFRTWLYTIATNAGLNALRSRRRRGESVPLDDAFSLSDAKIEEAWQALEREERAEHVARAIEKLPARSALLVHLHYREEMSLREAGEIVGMSEGAAKVALLRARRSLREWLVEGETP
ncbi:MAG: sigma-70 family RNA polymerase sigma factor [Candidatus Hydrogenedentes bacterium]|nr:sigma-70 family RNA polymerase sigma factor [Candidatus Hydrogenedentota bacterium]